MVKWHKIYIYSERVEQWDKQTIIEMPSKSEFQGYFFLLPKKMVFSISPEYSYFYFPDTWNFFLKKHTEKKEISAAKMLLLFKQESEAIMQFFQTKKVNESIIKVRTHIPKKIEKDVIIQHDLIR
ncbi:hypothetical protein QJV14_01940 [Listeria cossartiae subsp. cayugensis]|uniref:Uncharacterized protein n=1 Tax=Listeria cossartiae subsp. cayugensis TaxID=2713505 RepID=A0A7X0ZBR6_9LIST|nr:MULTISPECIES: hypothetical protein [Listeria]MBC1805724.1 hypothetical protein [Listeria cossartiae subsp. cayugensis]MBC2249383.1 hypothetical protein [Listeria cossartiae subsp. cayugensis]MDT0002934.1 hypothetical protein [Listeria cossartiae subsp. cayugensis]MDT0013261.1 hypothetical protein [Listeria cossartiae subsp. cayugensis]MDT0018698.1 hypothetical protein [Listeria cossartiae subsp. cayugensis]